LPFERPVKLYCPKEFVVTVAFAAPVRVTVTPATGVKNGVLIVPEIVYVTGAVPVKFCPVTFALFTVTFLLTGENV